MLTTVVLIIGGGALFVVAVLFATLVTDAIRNGVPVTRIGVWAAATRHGYIDITDDPSNGEAAELLWAGDDVSQDAGQQNQPVPT